jgi:hypothetical protein
MANKNKFIWNKPEDWDNFNRWCGIVYLSNKNDHVIFREMHVGDKMPEDCVIWATINQLMKYGLENSDMKHLLNKDEN